MMNKFKFTLDKLRELQSKPLNEKIEMSYCIIEQWWKQFDGNIYVAYSGGKDSLVLLHLVRTLFPDTIAVYSDTGLEYPELKDAVKLTDNVKIIRPKLSYRQVIKKYGYPVISKMQSRFIRDVKNRSDKNKATVNLRLTGYTRAGNYVPSKRISKKWLYLIDAPFDISEQCCNALKKNPLNSYAKQNKSYPLSGSRTEESSHRERQWLMYGCSIEDTNYPISYPLSFWTEQDILQYIIDNNLVLPSVYGNIIKNDDGKLGLSGVSRTGCVWCMYGVHLEPKNNNRFHKLKKSHPKIYDYAINKLELGKVLDYLGVNY